MRPQKADEAEAPAADASTPTVEQHAIPQPVMREPVIIPTLTIQPDERDAPTVDGQDEPAPEPRGTGRDGRGTGRRAGREETDDAQAEEKPKPGKTSRRGKAGADDEAWLAWIDELTAKKARIRPRRRQWTRDWPRAAAPRGISPASEESIRKVLSHGTPSMSDKDFHAVRRDPAGSGGTRWTRTVDVSPADSPNGGIRVGR